MKKKRGSVIWGMIGLFLLTKLKALLAFLKIGKFGGTLISMFVSIGGYALAAPLPFAIGFVLLILVHEMGHVWAAKQKGLPVSAPVFIPFLGALITMKRFPRDAVTEAYLAIGGPILGTVGALAMLAAGIAFRSSTMIALAQIGFLLNLINLLPIHPLDGGRIATAVTRWLWVIGLVGGLAVIVYLRSFLFLLIWVFFAWDLFQNYVWKRKKSKPLVHLVKRKVAMQELIDAGVFIPGENHRREIPFTTFCDMEGQQYVRFWWDGVFPDTETNLSPSPPAWIHRVNLIGLKRDDAAGQLTLSIAVEYETIVSDKYYDVPVMVRIAFGAVYGLLAVLLGLMMMVTHQLMNG